MGGCLGPGNAAIQTLTVPSSGQLLDAVGLSVAGKALWRADPLLPKNHSSQFRMRRVDDAVGLTAEGWRISGINSATVGSASH